VTVHTYIIASDATPNRWGLGFHMTRREYPNAIFNVCLGVFAFAVAYGRFVVSPF
jgi:hypothetical protein